MKPYGEPGIQASESDFYVNVASEFAKMYLFYTERGGHYYVTRGYLHSRSGFSLHFYLLYYILHGELLFTIDGKEYILHQNELLIADTTKAHLFAATTDDTELIWIRFQGNSSPAIVKRIYENRHAFTSPNITLTKDYLFSIVNGFVEGNPLPEEIISSHIHVILSDLLSLRYNLPSSSSDIDEQIRYIEKNYSSCITVQELARSACLNTNYFSAKFKAQTGYTPKQYLIRTRLNAAKILLQDTSWSVQQISDEVGFASDAYFSSYFRRMFSETPSQYRQRILQ